MGAIANEANLGHGDECDREGGAEVVAPSVGVSEGYCVTALALLPANTLMDDRALATSLRISTRTLSRMVVKGQLPNGVKLGGRRVWMAGKIVEYISAAADRLAAEARRQSIRFAGVED
jgi:predicted DNA-binding transcriptional regulator AlpA